MCGDDWNEYGTYEQEDDLYQMNQREADDYLNEARDEYLEEAIEEEYHDEEADLMESGEEP